MSTSSSQSAKRPNYRTIAEEAWKRQEKVPADLFWMLYGGAAADTWRQCSGNVTKANQKLDKLGYEMGVRLIEGFCAATGLGGCQEWREVGESIVRPLMKCFLNISVNIEYPSDDALMELAVVFPQSDEGVQTAFRDVVLPEDAAAAGFAYLQVFCGLLRGCLEAVYWRTECRVTRDVLRGDSNSEIAIKLIDRMDQERPPDDD